MVSFLTFAYNEGKFIEEAIKSVLQISEEIEFVLVDDNSNDNTWEIMTKYEVLDSRVKAYKNPKKGKNSAVNCGMSHCNGDWVMILGGDDILEAQNYSFFANEMKKHNPLEEQVFIGGLVRRFTNSERFMSENGVLNSFPRKSEHRACTNGFASRKAINNIYPIPEEYPNEDSWTAMYYYYFCDSLINIPVVCLNYRIHENNSLNHNDEDFKKYSYSLHIRSNQQLDFIERYGHLLSDKDTKYLINQYKAEDYRYRKKYIRLLFSRISFAEKTRMLLNSNKFLKKLKYKMTRIAQHK